MTCLGDGFTYEQAMDIPDPDLFNAAWRQRLCRQGAAPGGCLLRPIINPGWSLGAAQAGDVADAVGRARLAGDAPALPLGGAPVSSSPILAIDPGTTESAWVLWGGGRLLDCRKESNDAVLLRLQTGLWTIERLAIEMVASYGMPVGEEVFETVRWVGRFQQAWASPEEVQLVKRMAVKMHLCNSSRATDANIRQRLIDLVGPPGTKRAPGLTRGIVGDMWQALAIVATVEGWR